MHLRTWLSGGSCKKKHPGLGYSEVVLGCPEDPMPIRKVVLGCPEDPYVNRKSSAWLSGGSYAHR